MAGDKCIKSCGVCPVSTLWYLFEGPRSTIIAMAQIREHKFGDVGTFTLRALGLWMVVLVMYDFLKYMNSECLDANGNCMSKPAEPQ